MMEGTKKSAGAAKLWNILVHTEQWHVFCGMTIQEQTFVRMQRKLTPSRSLPVRTMRGEALNSRFACIQVQYFLLR